MYKTSSVAKIIGIHPNTVRNYEQLGFISKPERLKNGYRVFTELHIEQMRLARAALQIEVLQNGLRKKALGIINASAESRFDEAEVLAKNYLEQIKRELAISEETIEIAKKLLTGDSPEEDARCLTRKQTASLLCVTQDTLRNWELNGLLSVKRKQNGYRVYTGEDIRRLKIIRSLRLGNFSLSAILRMLNTLNKNPDADIREIINSPEQDEEIISACDNLLTSLRIAEKNAKSMLNSIEKMKSLKKSNPPL